MTTLYNLTSTDGTLNIIVQPFTTNGPASPSSPLPLFSGAVSANTSLIFVGKADIDYGQPIQSNWLHMLENFANTTSPAYPIAGQLWFKKDTNQLNICTDPSIPTWTNIVVNGTMTIPIDVNDQRIINVLDPTSPQDVATKFYVDNAVVGSGTFVEINGASIMTGNLNLGTNKIINVANPTNPQDAATKFYIDNKTLSSLLDVNLFFPTNDQVLTYTGTVWTNANSGSGAETLNDLTDVILTSPTPAQILTFDGANWVNADESAKQASNIQYNTDTTISVGNGNRFQDLTFSTNSLFPTSTLKDLLTLITQDLYNLTKPNHRQVSSSSLTTYTLNFSYIIETAKLQVFVDGKKQYADERGMSAISITGPLTKYTNTTLAGDTTSGSVPYTFNITVDGVGPTLITITVNQPTYNIVSSTSPAPFSWIVTGDQTATFVANSVFNVVGASVGNGAYRVITSTFDGVNTEIFVPFVPAGSIGGYLVQNYSYGKLVQDITTALATAVVPAVCALIPTGIQIWSNTTGNSSSVVVANTGANPLWTTLSGSITNITGVTHQYTEGSPSLALALTNIVTFYVAPTVGAGVEFINIK